MAVWAERACAEHLPEILRLNDLHEAETSRLDASTLARLVADSFATLVVDAGRTGFVIAFDEGAEYGSPNFQWFKARYPSFVYVDRVIVAPEARGRGVARRLYQDICIAAAASGRQHVMCEVNVLPPNPVSDAFHAALGFTEVGRATLDGTRKTVRYLARDIAG
jgi:predicted GNAT superfamily acetyltransferase